MSCDVGEATEGLENELWRRWSDGKVGEWARSPTFPFTSPTSQLILQPFRRFTYVTAYSPTLPLLHLCHSSFSVSSFFSPTSQALHLIHLANRPWWGVEVWERFVYGDGCAFHMSLTNPTTQCSKLQKGFKMLTSYMIAQRTTAAQRPTHIVKYVRLLMKLWLFTAPKPWISELELLLKNDLFTVPPNIPSVAGVCFIQGGREISAILLTVVEDGWKDQKNVYYNMGSKLDSFLRKRCFLFLFCSRRTAYIVGDNAKQNYISRFILQGPNIIFKNILPPPLWDRW